MLACAGRTLSRLFTGHSIAAVGVFKSSLSATDGGTTPELRPKTLLAVSRSAGAVAVRRSRVRLQLCPPRTKRYPIRPSVTDAFLRCMEAHAVATREEAKEGGDFNWISVEDAIAPSERTCQMVPQIAEAWRDISAKIKATIAEPLVAVHIGRLTNPEHPSVK